MFYYNIGIGFLLILQYILYAAGARPGLLLWDILESKLFLSHKIAN